MARKLSAAAVAGVVASIAAPASAAADFAALNEVLVADYLLPRYEALAEAGSVLEAALRQDCGAGTLAADTSIAAYHRMADAWMAVQHLRFGPSELFLRADRIQFWPDKRGIIDRHLGRLLTVADPAALDPQRFGQGSVAVQGLPALERLFFAPPEGADPAFACDVAVAIGANLKNIASGLLADWREGPAPYAAVIRSAAEGNAAYMDAREASLQFAKALRAALVATTDLKLDRPLSTSAKAVKPRRAESWRSARSLRNIRINIESAEALYRGDGQGGFAALLRRQAGGAEVDRNIAAAFAQARTRLEALPDSLQAALDQPDGWQRLDDLRSDLRGLLALLSGPFSQTLDLPLGFNSFDGD
ncbi:MAG TPA: hypothetical protein EYP07_01170 [Kiloniellaceae bacterium]|nr:hypothetical protein [Kiloniellaceae bacterium]